MVTRLQYRAGKHDRIALLLCREVTEMEERRRKRRKAYVHQTDCVACGCCVKVCPLGAIRVLRGISARVDETMCGLRPLREGVPCVGD